MSIEENKATVRRFIEEGINECNPAIADELIAPEYVAMSGAVVHQRGIEGAKQSFYLLREWFSSEFKDVIEEMVAEGDTVVVRALRTGTHVGPITHSISGIIPPTGNKIAYQAVFVFRLSGGKITELRMFPDSAEFLKQLGAISLR